jgi:hypothetical protein
VHLFHKTALAITISVNLGVDLVQQTGLLVLSASRGRGRRATGVGVVGISNRAVLSEGRGHAILGGVGAVVTSEVVVLLAVVTSRASGSSAGSASKASSSVDTLSLVQLTLVEASSIVAVAGSVVVVTVAGSTRDIVVIVMTMTLADGAKAASCASADVLGNTLESVVALLTAGKRSTLSSELRHGHGRQGCGAVVGSLVVVNLVDRNGGVNNVGLNGLLLNDGLDGLMDVVVDVLTTDGSSSALAVRCSVYTTLILEACLLLDKAPLCRVVVTVVELAVLNGTELSSVLLRKNLAVLDRLNSAVVVVLVNLLVDSGLNLLVCVGLNNLVLNSRSNSLVDCGVVVSRLGHEVGDSCLGLVHCDVCCVIDIEVVEVLSEEVLGVVKLRELVIDDGIMMSLSSSCLNSLYLCTMGAYAERRN